MADVETAKLLIKIGGIISLIVGVLGGLVLLITIIGIILAIPAFILAWWIYKRSNEVVELVDIGEYKEAKNKLIIPMVLSLLFFSTVSGILMLVGLILLPSEPSTHSKLEKS
ncbi:hypothetical protein E3E35_08580 [Thermococcus sp. GR7]|uniref:hypothetical protein n=1 Tax=unclassified Thermococcus TaxID=2627626 RepID=UPI00142FC8F8|nr:MULTISPECIES: hypothetical protein [unclassified Thermococcus]NJE47453.1 hypothetical protein [Thermococcus sp. GR7]NJE79250.1 hypothetical protein [Thermococcus sp. GR4]NJF23503.1 hypothetical protein [Thermococcus sp. GR5]